MVDTTPIHSLVPHMFFTSAAMMCSCVQPCRHTVGDKLGMTFVDSECLQCLLKDGTF